MSDARAEHLEAIRRLLDQVADDEAAVLPRITASLATAPYFEVLTRSLVDEARAQGTTWEDLADVLGTSPLNVKARYGSYRDYDDEEDGDG